jgi:hypothetical protein
MAGISDLRARFEEHTAAGGRARTARKASGNGVGLPTEKLPQLVGVRLTGSNNTNQNANHLPFTADDLAPADISTTVSRICMQRR